MSTRATVEQEAELLPVIRRRIAKLARCMKDAHADNDWQYYNELAAAQQAYQAVLHALETGNTDKI